MVAPSYIFHYKRYPIIFFIRLYSCSGDGALMHLDLITTKHSSLHVLQLPRQSLFLRLM